MSARVWWEPSVKDVLIEIVLPPSMPDDAPLKLLRPSEGLVSKTLQRLALSASRRLTTREKYNSKGRGKGKGTSNFMGSSASTIAVNILCPDGIALSEYASNSMIGKLGPGSCILLNGNRLPIEINLPRVTRLLLPRQPSVGIPLVADLEIVGAADPVATRWRWLISNQGVRVQVSERRELVPSPEHEGTSIICECTPVDSNGRAGRTAVVQTQAISGSLPRRPWLLRPLVRCEAAIGVMDACRFRTISYNVLADAYAGSAMAHTKLYPYCSRAHLSRGFREQLLIEELLVYDCDVLCLQEVDSSLFIRILLPLLGSRGYHGRLSLKGDKGTEGVATFWRMSVFELIALEKVSMSEACDDPKNSDLFGSLSDVVTKSLRKVSSVGQVVRLAYVQTGRVVVLVNTHLFYHPGAPHARNIHTAVLLREATAALQAASNSCGAAGIVFAGDLNSTPETGVVEFLSTGSLSGSHPEWDFGSRFQWGNYVENIPNNPGGTTKEPVDTLQPEPISASGQRRGNLPPLWAKTLDSVEAADNGNSVRATKFPALTHSLGLVSAYPLDEMVSNSTNYTAGFCGWSVCFFPSIDCFMGTPTIIFLLLEYWYDLW